jgi:hypothetical protein
VRTGILHAAARSPVYGLEPFHGAQARRQPARVLRAEPCCAARRALAELLVREIVRDDMIVGADAGAYCSAFVAAVGAALGCGALRGVRFVAACDAAASEAAFAGVPQVCPTLTHLSRRPSPLQAVHVQKVLGLV